MDARFNEIQAGWSAYGRDGEKIGDIEEVGPNYLLVTKGLIFVTDLYIPVDVIDNVDASEGRVYLTVDKNAVEDQGWNEPPVRGETMATAGSDGPVEGLGYTGREADESSATMTNAYTGGTGTSDYGTTDYGTTGTTDYGTTGTGTDSVRVPVHEESLRAERVAEQAGEVRVGKHVVEEQQSIDVPVTREEVEIRRVSTDRPAAGSQDAFTEGDTIRVPITAEHVNVDKEARVVEEIEISKRPVTETQRVTDTVRREELDVDETGNVLTGAGAATTGTGHELNQSATYGSQTAGDVDDDDLTRR